MSDFSWMLWTGQGRHSQGIAFRSFVHRQHCWNHRRASGEKTCSWKCQTWPGCRSANYAHSSWQNFCRKPPPPPSTQTQENAEPSISYILSLGHNLAFVCKNEVLRICLLISNLAPKPFSWMTLDVPELHYFIWFIYPAVLKWKWFWPPPIRQCLGTLLAVTFWVGDVEGAPGMWPVEARDAATNLTMHQEASMTENYLTPNVHSV